MGSEQSTQGNGDSSYVKDYVSAHSDQLQFIGPNQELLECRNCLDICIPPILQCDNGHNICGKCSRQLTKCSSCSTGYHRNRNFDLENYFEENCSLPCQFSKDGCQEIVLLKTLKTHHEECDFRPLPCHSCTHQTPGTNTFISISGYSTHLTNFHRAVYSSDLDGDFNLPMQWAHLLLNANNGLIPWDPYLLEFDGFKFVLMNVWRQFTVGTWISIIGSEDQGKQFHAQISIGSKNNDEEANDALNNMSKNCVCWEGPLFSLRSSWSSILEESNCMLTSIYFIRSICEPSPTAASGLGFKIRCKLSKTEN